MEAPASRSQQAARSTDPGPRRLRRLRPPTLAVGVALLPFLVAAVAVALTVGGGYHPLGDNAQIVMRVRDVGGHAVLRGPFSRFDWHHPGPALFYLLAAPYRLAGGTPVAVNLGALAINGGAVAGMAWIARRRGGMPLMLITLIASGLLVRALGADFVRDPWNPSVTVLPFGLMLFVTWAMTCRETWALPAGAALASFLAQTHVGYVALALPLFAWGAVWLAGPTVVHRWKARQGRSEAAGAARTTGPDPGAAPVAPDERALRRAAVLAGIILAIMWAPVLVDQFTGSPGNLTALIAYFWSADDPARGPADAWQILSAHLALPPRWLTGPATTLGGEPAALYRGLILPVLLIPLGWAGAAVWRRAGEDGKRFVLTLSVALLLALIALSRVTGVAYAYLFNWIHVLGATTGILLAWAVWLAARPHLGQAATRRLAGAAAAGLVLVSTINAAAAARSSAPQDPGSEALATLLPRLEENLPDGDGVVVISPRGFGGMVVAPGLQLGLERAGVPARMMPYAADAAGEHRIVDGERRAATLVVAIDEQVTPLLADPTLEPVATWGPLPPAAHAPDDPVHRAAQAFATGDHAAIRDLGRTYGDEHGFDVMFQPETVAVFVDGSTRR